MTRDTKVQRQRTQNNPLVLGSFDTTTLKYLNGRLGPLNQLVGTADTSQQSNGGHGNGTYNHWFQINLKTPAWIIVVKSGSRPNYIQTSVYDLNKQPIEGRGIFQDDSVEITSGTNTFYPYFSTAMGAQSDLYNTFDSGRLDRGDERYYPLDAGGYLLCVSTTRNELLDYEVGLVIEFPITEMFIETEDEQENEITFLVQETAIDTARTINVISPVNFNTIVSPSTEQPNGFTELLAIVNPGIMVTVLAGSEWFIGNQVPSSEEAEYKIPVDAGLPFFDSVHDHSLIEWRESWEATHQDTDKFPEAFIPLTNRRGNDYAIVQRVPVIAPVVNPPLVNVIVTQDNYLALSLGNLMDAYNPTNIEWAYYKLDRNTSEAFENYVAGINVGGFLFKKRSAFTMADMNGTSQYFRTDPESTSRGFLGNSGTANNTVGLWFWFDTLPVSNKFLWIASNSTQTIYSGLRFNATTQQLEYIRYSQGLFNVSVVSVNLIEADRLYTTICRYNSSTGNQELFIDGILEASTISLSTLAITAGDLNPITVAVSENEGFTAVSVGRFRLAGILLDDANIQQLMSVPMPEIFFGVGTVIGTEWIVVFDNETLGFTIPAGLAKQDHTVYARINGVSNTPIVASYIDIPIRDTALSITFDNQAAIDLYFDKLYQQWGGANGGVVPQNVSIGADNEGDQVLVLECHGDYYTGSVQGVNNQGQPKFNEDGTPWVKRVGGVIASKDYFCFGRYEYVSKVVQVLGVASAFWNFHYQEIYPDDPRWDSYINDLGLHVSGDAVDGYYIARNNEIDVELPSHLLGGDIEDPSLANGKFNTWRGQLQNYDVAPGAPGYWEEYRDNYRALGFNAADDQYHTYRYDWYHDRVEFYVDNVLIVTNINNQFGYDSNNLPDVVGKVTIGPWFPSAAQKWAGPFANFAVEKMYVRSFSYTPFSDEITNHQVIVGETFALLTANKVKNEAV